MVALEARRISTEVNGLWDYNRIHDALIEMVKSACSEGKWEQGNTFPVTYTKKLQTRIEKDFVSMGYEVYVQKAEGIIETEEGQRKKVVCTFVNLRWS